MKSESHTTQELLLAAHRRLACCAVAFISVSRDTFDFRCTPGDDGRHPKEMMARTADAFLLESRERFDPIVRNRVREVSGGPLVCRFLAAPVRGADAELIGILIVHRKADAEEFGARESRLAMRYARLLGRSASVQRDALTGLATRTGFEKQISRRDPDANRPGAAMLLYGDIDQLHVINDLWGFETGDRAIAAVGELMQTQLASHDAVLSRLSGDRFTVFLPDCTLARARQIADRIREAVCGLRLAAHSEEIPLSMSWGVATLRAGDNGLDHGLAAAEVACKAAKDRGRNRVEVYQEADVSIMRRRDDMLIVGQLRHALDEGRFEIFGQPIASLLEPEDTRRYELLVRILDEDDKLVLPAQFMSAATRYQLLPLLDRCVISHVLGRLREAAAQPGYRPVHVSMNLSGPTISEPEFLEWLLGEVTGSGIPGDLLSFELTETAAVANLERAQLLIERLGARGCRFALDDFGTGMSSLAHLQTLNFSILKIDGTFVRDLLTNKRSESLVRAVAQLANSMGMETVAEYVETPEVCMRLIELQVQFGQGYAIGRPVKFDRILNPAALLARAS